MTATTGIPPEIAPGLEATVEKVVPHESTIAYFRGVLPAVLSTPAMIGMMEVAAAKAVQDKLPEGAITVGTRIEVDHLKAVPEGASVQAWARLERIDGRFLVYQVEARSGPHVVGRGRVSRAIVYPHMLMQKAETRKSS